VASVKYSLFYGKGLTECGRFLGSVGQPWSGLARTSETVRLYQSISLDCINKQDVTRSVKCAPVVYRKRKLTFSGGISELDAAG